MAVIRQSCPVHPDPTARLSLSNAPRSTLRYRRDIGGIFRVLNMPAEWCRFRMDSGKQVFRLLSVAVQPLLAMELDPASRRAELGVFPLRGKLVSAGLADAS